MKTIVLDNHVLLWGVRESATAGQEEMIPRAMNFLKECHKDSVDLLVPSVVLAEFLTAIEPKSHAMVHNLMKTSFVVPPFDSAASVIFAKLWQDRVDAGVISRLKDDGATKQELKADCMIVATAIVQKADAICSHDDKLRKFAGTSINVIEIPRIPVQASMDLIPATAG